MTARFEALNHRLLDDTYATVPMYLKGREWAPESNTLLTAVDIIAASLKSPTTLGLEGLTNAVKAIAAGEKVPGMIIEDDDGYGSVQASPDTTTVSLRRMGNAAVPTELFSDMLATWAGYAQDETLPA